MSQKIRVDRELFLEKIKSVNKFVSDNNIVAAMANIKFTVKENMMELVAVDPEAQIKMYMSVKGDDMAMCINADLLLKTINLFRENDVQITKNSETKLTLKNGKSKYVLTMDTLPEDFPMMKDEGSGDEFLMLQYYLKLGLKFSGKFISDDSMKVNAHGINCAEIDNQIIFTGVDNATMCRVNVKPISIATWTKNIVIPTTTSSKILSLLDDKGEIYVCRSGDKVVFMADGKTSEKFEVTSVVMNDKFPNSEKIFTYRTEDFMVINNLELRDAVSRLKLYCSPLDKAKRVTIKTNPENMDELILNSIDNDFGREGEEIMTVKNNAGKAIDKCFSVDYLLRILHCIEATDIQFFWHESDKVACFINPIDEEQNFQFMLIGHTKD
ncbi:MAG TPA: hypothetical protein ACFYEK_01310 [Candidatus Wunengus sp. YC60]|uniref:hypothetical protein n=1 Tax=Candidatus Wunengus sp. YC60 TaxID=3367697 RepID=UPI0040286BFA